MLDTEDSLAPGSEQTAWLEAELADASAQPGYRFSIVDFHKPWVTCGDTGTRRICGRTSSRSSPNTAS